MLATKSVPARQSWLNTSPAQEGDSLQAYLQKWHNAAPERHQEFIREIGCLYGVEVGPED